MQSLYFIHTPQDWSAEDVKAMEQELGALGLAQSRDAAIGEGGGGTGFETMIEIALDFLGHPIVSTVVGGLILQAANNLRKRKPKSKQLPPGIRPVYKLIVHVIAKDTHIIVGVDLNSSEQDAEKAIKEKLEPKLRQNPTRLYQNGDDWDVY